MAPKKGLNEGLLNYYDPGNSTKDSPGLPWVDYWKYKCEYDSSTIAYNSIIV